ncbi:beta-glucosidase [Sphingomonas gilva]|uniref:beta-glucosidase n=1 Tax=Sphingomonas gilva TaxID=2305907 RepID=A0A396RM62_9SPHN|nr:glycoside hydrolase family 3 N-terminal domain-containing protein [Sphingomonas gilva]RHW17359.1 beta-glucosidase [Sphingomonas gilva]
MTATIDRRLVRADAVTGLAAVPSATFAASPRIEALIARMTIEEKAGQLSCFADTLRPFAPNINPLVGNQNAEATLGEIRAGRVGTLFNGIGVAGARRAQKAALEESRLGIPLLFAADVIHGLKTVFPIPLAESCSFDLDLAEATARGAALEATAVGLHWTFAPMVDVARDQRWSRVAEGAGEDPWLGGELARARVRGFQGADLKRDDTMLACPKHFVGYGAVSGGMDYNSVELSEASLREIHLPPFAEAFDEGALTAMSAFNDVNGVPASGNRALITGLLRGQWRFAGLVISDYTSDQELVAHGYAADDRDAARLAILAGVDISMQSGLYVDYLPGLVESGVVPMAVVDASVRRVLHVKEALGLFDNPYRSLDTGAEQRRVQTPAMTSLARDAGARSIVLLRNEGGLLPLSPDAGRYALIGPCADEDVLGPWSFYGDAERNISIEAGVRAALGPGGSLSVVRGSDIESPIEGGIAAAVAAAENADVVLLAIGESSGMSGEAQSVTDIRVPHAQRALAEAVVATGKPVVVLLRHGRALALSGAIGDAPAILATWFLGSEMGNAVADVLFGKVNPSARLAVSFPRESGQQPYFYNHRTTGRPAPQTESQEFKARYRSTKNEARYAFGHGLSYTSFAIDALELPETMAWNGEIAITARVTNTGERTGRHVAQLYIRDRVASRTRPVRELKGIAPVTLAPGASEVVRFTLDHQDLMFWGDGGWMVEPGEFDIWIADHAEDEGVSGRFTLSAA